MQFSAKLLGPIVEDVALHFLCSHSDEVIMPRDQTMSSGCLYPDLVVNQHMIPDQ